MNIDQAKLMSGRHTVMLCLSVIAAACDQPERERIGTVTEDSVITVDSIGVAGARKGGDSAATGQGAIDPPSFDATDSLRASLDRLVSGMGGDTATWFSEHTADILRSVEVDGRGHAIVDFHDLRQVIPNASSSAGSALLLHQVNAAVFAIPGVASVEYRMNGSCELLGEWLQYGVCLRFDADGEQQ